MRQFLHSLLWIAAALMALVLLSPWLLYEWGAAADRGRAVQACLESLR